MGEVPRAPAMEKATPKAMTASPTARQRQRAGMCLREFLVPCKKRPPYPNGGTGKSRLFNLHRLHFFFGNIIFFPVFRPVGCGGLQEHGFGQGHSGVEAGVPLFFHGAGELFNAASRQEAEGSVQNSLSAADFQHGAERPAVLAAEQGNHFHRRVVLGVLQKAAVDEHGQR